MTTTLVSETLNKAADLIQVDGWRQGDVGPGNCTLNAIGHAGRASGLIPPAHDAMRKYLGVGYVHVWNDAPGRTAAEVIEALRACALIEAAREEQDAAEATYAENLTASA